MNLGTRLLGTAVQATGWSPTNIKRAALVAIGAAFMVALVVCWFGWSAANERVATRDATIQDLTNRLAVSNAGIGRLQDQVADQNRRVQALQVEGQRRAAEGAAAAAAVDAREDEIAALKRSASAPRAAGTCAPSQAFQSVARKGI